MEFNYTLHTFRSPAFQSVVNEAISFFENMPLYALPPVSFNGAGVYGLYYIGDHPLYAKLASINQPPTARAIYIGKAVAPGWRTGRSISAGKAELWRRLNEHGRSIQQSIDLQLADFRCRFIILNGNEGDLVVPIEAALIRKYQPLWNTVVDGFGNHDPGRGRYNQAVSEWDILHPGRPWAARLLGVSPRREDIVTKVQLFLNTTSS
jgi:hypothetical protein